MQVEFKEDAKESFLTTNRKCELCSERDSLYTCPKCNKLYCSMNCYRDPNKHLECSESFYQEQVINELKMCKIDDESKHRMVDILKRNAEDLENEDNFIDNKPEQSIIPENIDDSQLIKAYEEVVKKFQPWWHSYLNQKHLINESEKKFKFNANLLKNVQNLSAKNANELIINDIYQVFFIYSAVVYIYQIDEHILPNTKDAYNLIDEAAQCVLQTNKLCATNLLKTSSLKSFLNSTVHILIENQSLFLNTYLNNNFLASLLDEMISITDTPMVMLKICSNLYNLISEFIKDAKKNQNTEDIVYTETPINVFSYNRDSDIKKTHETSGKVSRVQIIRQNKIDKDKKPNEKNSKTANLNDFSINYLAEAKLLLKKIEFYFKWLTLNQMSINSGDFIKQKCDELKDLKQSLIQKEEHFKSDQKFIEKNLEAIRKKQFLLNKESLIEEI